MKYLFIIPLASLALLCNHLYAADKPSIDLATATQILKTQLAKDKLSERKFDIRYTQDTPSNKPVYLAIVSPDTSKGTPITNGDYIVYLIGMDKSISKGKVTSQHTLSSAVPLEKPISLNLAPR